MVGRPERPIRNPFLRGPCFSGPMDHSQCREYLDHRGAMWKCPCKCGHPEPPKVKEGGRKR